MGSILLKILKKLGLLKVFNFTLTKSFNHSNIRIPVIREMGYENIIANPEPWMDQILENLLQTEKQSSFIDIGVNLGQTLIKLKSINPNIPYLGFEPNPDCNYYLDNLIRINEFVDTKVYPIGISSTTDVLELILFDERSTDSSASIIQDFRNPNSIKRKRYVPVFEFSNLNLNPGDQIIVKIDVEGAELEVLKGLGNLLESKRPFVIIEILPVYNSENEFRIKRQKEIEQLLNSMNYKIFRIEKKNNVFKSLNELNEFGIHSDLKQCDYILAPVEKTNMIVENFKQTGRVEPGK